MLFVKIGDIVDVSAFWWDDKKVHIQTDTYKMIAIDQDVLAWWWLIFNIWYSGNQIKLEWRW